MYKTKKPPPPTGGALLSISISNLLSPKSKVEKYIKSNASRGLM